MSEAPRPDPQRLLASFPLAVVLIGPDRAIAGVNPAAEQLLGQGARRVLGRALAEVIDFVEPHVAARLSEPDAQFFARGCAARIGGGARQVDVMLGPVAGHPGWRMLTLHEPLGVEALGGEPRGADSVPLRAPEVLAHEIKNPLAAIRGAAQLLARSGTEGQRAMTALITAEVDRITKLIDQMQSLSQRSVAPASLCNVHEPLRRALAVLAAGDPGAPAVAEEFDPSLPPVLCSPDALVQVVLNLLGNARDACAGVRRPRIMLRTRFASGIRLHGASGEPPLPLPIEIRVSDNGPGIAAGLREHVFEPFVSGKKHGQGLGLALVQKLVGEMSGRITHDRDEVAGLTHFRVHLPVAHERRAGLRAEAA